MSTRRIFIKKVSATIAGSVLLGRNMFGKPPEKQAGKTHKGYKPIVISTWKHGVVANTKAWDTLKNGGKSIDAVQYGVMEIESDPENTSVGLGGLPDREGKVTLDACIMDERNRCGSVAFLTDVVNAIAVARQVMEKTPHVMLVGEGALEFALKQGFKKINLLTKKAEERWKEWMKESHYQPEINIENHDTIGMVALDGLGDLSGACTTSGLAFKMHGRVGDSPIIGAGLFVDNEVGAATATGVGEAVIRIAGTHTIVELMRQGMPPVDACRTAIERIANKVEGADKIQVGFLALNKDGEYGAYSLHKGFSFAVKSATMDELKDAGHHF